MPDDTVALHDWIDYQPVWLIVGLLLAALLIAWYLFVFIYTRYKPQRTMATLPPAPYVPPDLTQLRAKYLQLIQRAEVSHTANDISARKLHQMLSYLLRMFAYEATGHRVDTFTLDDLQQTRYQQLATVVKAYYMPEFSAVKSGNVTEALALARKVVTEWN